MNRFRRVTLFAGHYGSGKTNLAVNYALFLNKNGVNVTIADLDIVNPYFRTKDSAAELEQAGIPLISPRFANSNVDLPALPQELYGLVENRERYAVMDIGGDDRGAYALGRYAPYIMEENDYEMLFVVNFFRPLTQNAEQALEVLREIAVAGGVPFTGIVNNSNVGWETTGDMLRSTYREAERLSELARLPILLTAAEQRVAAEMPGENIFPLILQKKYFDIKEN